MMEIKEKKIAIDEEKRAEEKMAKFFEFAKFGAARLLDARKPTKVCKFYIM